MADQLNQRKGYDRHGVKCTSEQHRLRGCCVGAQRRADVVADKRVDGQRKEQGSEDYPMNQQVFFCSFKVQGFNLPLIFFVF